MLDYQNQWKDERDAQTVWVTHEALELNLKNEKDFFKRTVRGRAFQAEWKTQVPQSILGNLQKFSWSTKDKRIGRSKAYSAPAASSVLYWLSHQTLQHSECGTDEKRESYRGYRTCSRLLTQQIFELKFDLSPRSDIINYHTQLSPSHSSSQTGFGFLSPQVAGKVPVCNQDIFLHKISKDSWCVECSHSTSSSFLG